MIAFVHGRVAQVGLSSAVIDVGGVGLELNCTPGTLAVLREGGNATLPTSMVVREDSLTLFGFAAVISISFGGLGVFLALRTGSGEAIQGLFPLLFVVLFLSSMNTPRNLIGVDWFQFVATVNPVSYLIEAVRSLVITGWDWQTLLLGFATAIILSTIGFTLAAHALWRRLERT